MDEPVRISEQGDGTLEVALFGDIDFANASTIRETVRAVVAEAAPTAIRVDLAAVTFLDSSGIALLVTAHRLAAGLGARYSVVNPTSTVYEHLRLTGLAGLFGVARPTAGGPRDVPGADRSSPPVGR
ncbi:STAS domain-containing protein [Planosporangium thailandense]|uniref:Anti-sigma factor antagonist n=1 Tax=Planosporangium thailandense TaxID=765197 RepID=A0ABX0Y6J6_9ACTN|nr:STAS domain-containing protein [Planosporangium thailandense]NJC74027.1 STAS domain-containing protein [Planosporangium thailandense]